MPAILVRIVLPTIGGERDRYFSHSDSMRGNSASSTVITSDHHEGDCDAREHVHREDGHHESGRRRDRAIRVRPADHAYGAVPSI